LISKSFSLNWDERSLEQLDQYCYETGLSRSKALEHLLLKERKMDLAKIPIWRVKFWNEVLQEATLQKINVTVQEKDGISYSHPFLNYVNFDFWKCININSQKKRDYSVVLYITKQAIVAEVRLVSKSKKKRDQITEQIKNNESSLKAAGFERKNIKTDFVIECRKMVCKEFTPVGKDWFNKLLLLDKIF